MKNIKAKSEQWKEAIASELEVNAEQYSMFELLCEFFENSDSYDEQECKRLRYEYDLDNVITDDEYKHTLSGVVLHTFKLCKEVYKYLSDRIEKFQYLKADKEWNKYLGYLANHSEKAVVNVVRSLNFSIIEVKVETTELEAEILYWNRGKVFIMNFMPELDEDVEVPLSIKES